MMNERDNSKYIWGIFYFNKDDKRIFPPKRNSLFGWTTNFANPYSILAHTIIIFAVVAVINFLF